MNARVSISSRQSGVFHSSSVRHRLALFILAFGCRHPEGIVCEHRHFEYDSWLAGYNQGYRVGVLREQGDTTENILTA